MPLQYRIKKEKSVSIFVQHAYQKNYNQTTESYAQAAARDAVVVGGCIAATRPMSVEAEHAVRGSTIESNNMIPYYVLNLINRF